jgi:hypothetical protein
MATKTTAPNARKPATSTVEAKLTHKAASADPTGASVAMREARRAGLFVGEKTHCASFRAPKVLVETAQHESGVTKQTELGLLALATLAQPDPTAKFLAETLGTLGAARQLNC